MVICLFSILVISGCSMNNICSGDQMSRHLVLKNRLKYYRSKRGLCQCDLAYNVGVSKNTISAIETGKFNPTALLAYKLCCFLGCTFEELFYIEIV